MSRASSEAVAMPIVMPTAPTACDVARVAMVRRWSASTSRPTVVVTCRPAGSSRAAHTARHTCLGGSPASSASEAVRPPRSPMTYWLAQDREYVGPSARSIRSQNSVCLTCVSRAR